MTAAFDVASRVLSAAADGETVPGFESVGELLIDLRTTTPVPPGTALGSPAVSAASAVTTSRFATLAVPTWVRFELILLSLAGLAVAGLLAFSWPQASTTEIVPGSDGDPAGGVAPLVDGDGGSDDAGSGEREAGGADTSTTTAAPTTSVTGVETTVAPAGTSAPSAPSTTATTGPTTTAPSPESSTTSMAPSTTTTVAPTTTTVAGGGEPPDAQGNNGNGNGKGVGNGKGNQGKGNQGKGKGDDDGSS